jgi:hypothetical protein
VVEQIQESKVSTPIFIGIPLLNRLDLLEKAIASYDHPHDLFIVNNNSMDADFNKAFDALQEKLRFDCRRPRYNLGCSASWNLILMQAIARGCEFCYVGSNDTISEPGELAKLVQVPRPPEEGMWMGCGFNFFCLRVAVIPIVGWFDENFYPGYFEDNDWVYRCSLASVGIGQPAIRMRHLGSQTVASDAICAQGNSRTFSANGAYYYAKWGGGPGGEKFKHPHNREDKNLKWWPDPGKTLESKDWDIPKRQKIEQIREIEKMDISSPEKAQKKALLDFEMACRLNSDVSGHLPVLYKIATLVDHVTEIGFRIGISTAAFLAAIPKTLHTYDDYQKEEDINRMTDIAKEMGVNFIYHKGSSPQTAIEETDLLFIDTTHTYDCLHAELNLHGPQVRHYLIFHDTETFGINGEQGSRGIWFAISEFLKQNRQWRLMRHDSHDHGLTILENVNQGKTQ